MGAVLSFIIANPALIGIAVTIAESVIMPLVPVKYDGLLNTVFSFLKSKYVKAKEVAEVKVEKNEAQKAMEEAVDENLKQSAETKLAE